MVSMLPEPPTSWEIALGQLGKGVAHGAGVRATAADEVDEHARAVPQEPAAQEAVRDEDVGEHVCDVEQLAEHEARQVAGCRIRARSAGSGPCWRCGRSGPGRPRLAAASPAGGRPAGGPRTASTASAARRRPRPAGTGRTPPTGSSRGSASRPSRCECPRRGRRCYLRDARAGSVIDVTCMNRTWGVPKSNASFSLNLGIVENSEIKSRQGCFSIIWLPNEYFFTSYSGHHDPDTSANVELLYFGEAVTEEIRRQHPESGLHEPLPCFARRPLRQFGGLGTDEGHRESGRCCNGGWVTTSMLRSFTGSVVPNCKGQFARCL